MPSKTFAGQFTSLEDISDFIAQAADEAGGVVIVRVLVVAVPGTVRPVQDRRPRRSGVSMPEIDFAGMQRGRQAGEESQVRREQQPEHQVILSLPDPAGREGSQSAR